MDALQGMGFGVFVSLRPTSEEGAGWEEAHAEAAGMRFVRIPVAGRDDLSRKHAEHLAAALVGTGPDSPALVYCKSGNRVVLHQYEQDLRAAREAWQRPEVREAYRKRSECERLVHQVTRHGGRKSRGWGLGAANLQVHVIAMRSNLGMLAKRLAEMEEQQRAKAA